MMAQPGFEQETFRSLLDGYLQRINQNDALQRLRGKAWDHFLELGLPSKSTEEYRYIKLRHLFSQNFQLAEEVKIDHADIASSILPECHHSLLVFVNGHYCPDLSNTSALPKQLVIAPLHEANRTYGAFLNNFWAKSLKEETDPFALLNSALHRDGAFIYLPPKTEISVPIQVLHVIKSDHQLLMHVPRLHFFIGAQSEATVVVTQKALSDSGYFVNQVAEISLEEGSRFHYTQILCDEPPSAWHLDAFRAVLKRNATLTTICVTEGSATVRTDYRVTLAGENAEALLNGVWMLSDKREAHTNVFIDHQAPNCRSYQLFKGVLRDFSRSSFEGKIMVRQAAQKTEAFQLNNNLLLNDHTHADSKPNLEIFADDVKASHGATIGQLDPEQLFYMKTRGFSEESAKNILVKGFCEEVINKIRVASLREQRTKKT